MVGMLFMDRRDAGRRLAERLRDHAGADAVVVGLPRGGVPVAFEVARALDAPLDVIVIRKLGVPFQPELGMGAIGEGGVRIINDRIVRGARVSADDFAEVERRERAELERRVRRFRGDRPAVPLAGRTVIVVDDGIATGSTARAACQVARAQGATRVLLAVPVGPPGIRERMGADADDVVCLDAPVNFFAVAQAYQDFAQITDAQVVELLEVAGTPDGRKPLLSTGFADPPGRDEDVIVRTGRVRLAGHLNLPAGAGGIVVFAHGSGSSRHSPRNRFVASALNAAGLGTLLFDLLTADEELDRANVFDIDLLADRLLEVTAWLRGEPQTAHVRVGYFGASTGAAAALTAAADPQAAIAAIVSRGGRPDLASLTLTKVRAPTLLIVGELDDTVLELNRAAQAQLRCENRLEIVAGATHLFEEPGALDSVARLAQGWFSSHLTG
jgi:putative phosphoribosyl transferase